MLQEIHIPTMNWRSPARINRLGIRKTKAESAGWNKPASMTSRLSKAPASSSRSTSQPMMSWSTNGLYGAMQARLRGQCHGQAIRAGDRLMSVAVRAPSAAERFDSAQRSGEPVLASDRRGRGGAAEAESVRRRTARPLWAVHSRAVAVEGMEASSDAVNLLIYRRLVEG
jgi:hypothetical protein